MASYIGGLDDLIVDLLFVAQRRPPLGDAQRFRALAPRGRLAVFVPAWDEAGVIGAMASAALDRFDHPDYRLYVGTYPNDPGTIAAIAPIAARDRRLRLVIGDHPGPTTKADCLNTLWRALLADEAAGAPRALAVVLHDAEDVVHPLELRVFDRLVGSFATVQIPVLPLIDRRARLVSGHYADEFAEAHGKQLIVRARLGAGLPLAGTGCAIVRAVLERLASARGGAPFAPDSLTEDYELGLAVAAMGGRGAFARFTAGEGGALVAVRAYFPATIRAAVRQKARWINGIALAGWDRTGWARRGGLADHWMRLRDRRAPLAVLVLVAAYAGLLLWAAALLLAALAGTPPPGALPTALVGATGALLAWRLALRVRFTAKIYGWREAGWAVPRAFVGNVIAMLAARRALTRYLQMLGGAPTRWDKTAHSFPDLPSAPQ